MIEKKRFNIQHFLIDIFNRKFVVWAVFMLFAWDTIHLFGAGDFAYIKTLIIGTIIISVMFFLACSIDKLLELLINKTNIDIKWGK